MRIDEAVQGLGPGPLTEEGVARWMRPLFERTLAGGGVYLANHTLGRPLDQMHEDLSEGAALWSDRLRDAWEPWLAEEARYRAVLASLLGLSRCDCVVPKASAGQALRAVLNTLPTGATVLTTKSEFASVAVVLSQYTACARLQVVFAEPAPEAMLAALASTPGVRLVVVSQVAYADARVFGRLPALASACREYGAELLVDCYHALGALPFTMGELGCEYLIGGCYKYLRGGPGAAFLALAPHVADRARPLDIGWFAQAPGAEPWQAGGPTLLAGGNAWLEGTPAVLTYYQARSGLAFTQAIGVERLRAYSLEQLRFLRSLLAEHGIKCEGADAEHGAFLTIPTPRAPEVVRALGEQGIMVDERGGRVRVCPDVLTTRAELEQVAGAIAVGSLR